MGLLDGLQGLLGTGFDDPRTMAVFQAAGLLGGPGGTMQRFAGAGQAYGGALNAAKQQALHQKLIEAQTADALAQSAQRQAQADKLKMGGAELEALLSGSGSPSQYGLAGGGVSMGGVREPMTATPPGLAGVPIEAIARLKARYGMDVLPEWKLAAIGEQMQPGYRITADGRREYLGDPVKGVTANNGRVSLMPGALESQSALAGATAGATTTATKTAEAPFTLVETVGPDGSTRKVTLASILAQQQQPQREAPQALADVMRANGDTSANYDIGGKRGTMNLGGAQPQGVKTGLSTNEKAAASALDEINKVWLKESYTPVVTAGENAGGMLTEIQTARKGLAMVGSGWGKGAQVAAARVLGALGVPQAEQMATGAQMFQQAASTRLWEVLNEAKGPQTEGDAERAQKTFARLENTPKANQFILDLAQAKAEREAMRARWYRDAVPIARQEGDLQIIDRKWQERMPSIYSMPSMRKWAQ